MGGCISRMVPSPHLRGTEFQRWEEKSLRWGTKLKELKRMENFKTVKNFIFCDNGDYLIARGSDGTEVFLGLRDDGTEVAIKRMTKTSYQLLRNEREFLRLPELDSPNIVRYVDFAEDDNFGYLVLQLCEYTLEEYIDPKYHQLPKDNKKKMDVLKRKVGEVLRSLQVLHDEESNVLHRDIKPQNVLIDIRGKARLADFGISRRLKAGQTSHHTSPAGTKCWKSRETLVAESKEELQEPTMSVCKKSSDIQVAGMLIFYILSCGHHPFGKGVRCEANILDGKYKLESVEDELAKDLIELMILADPSQRLTVEEALAHPYFWTDNRRKEYLRKLGNVREAQEHKKADASLLEDLQRCSTGRSFSNWIDKIPRETMDKMDKKRKVYRENTLALLRFIRNLYEHHDEDAKKIDLMDLFPDLFPSVYKVAKEKGWNCQPSLRDFLKE